jgi:putative aldouronate transport system substrate-binding protein
VDDESIRLDFEITIPTRHFEKNAYPLKVLEKAGNINITFNSTEPSEYARKKDLMMSSGNVPEIFTTDANGIRRYAKQKIIAPIPHDILIKYCPSYVALVNRLAPDIWLGGMYQGKNYGLPTLWPGARYPRTGIWRKYWLDKVGIEKVPETLDEMEEAFKRFSEDDPDGNGKKDTYGLSGDMSSWYTMFTDVFGAYDVMPYNWMLDKNGNFVYGGVQPEAKDALKRLRSWYKKGYLHPEFQTDKWYREVQNKMISGKIGYHNYLSSYEAFDPDSPASALNKVRKQGGDIVPAILPSGPNGKRGHRVWGTGTGYQVFSATLLKQQEKIIRYLKITEKLMQDEALFIELTLGKQGTHWDWRMKDGKRAGAKGLKSDYKGKLLDFSDNKVRAKHGLQQFIFVDRPVLHVAVLDDKIVDTYLNPGKVNFRKTYTPPAWGRPDLLGKPSVVSETVPILERLRQKQMRIYVEIITGDKELDSFETFVDEWYKEGGQELFDASKAYYENFKKLESQINEALNAR